MTFDEWQKGDRSLSDLRGLHRREEDFDHGIRLGVLYDMIKSGRPQRNIDRQIALIQECYSLKR